MKQILNSDTLTLTVNGATIVPEMARTLTKKRNGHALTLRVTANRAALCYLETGLYIAPALFDNKTKQIADRAQNETLQGLLGRAAKLVATTLQPAALKAGWERERNQMEQESTVEAMDLMADWQRLSSLYAKRDALELQLREVIEKIRVLELEEGLTPLPATSLLDVKEYTKAKNEFLLSIGGRSVRDVQAFTTFFADLDRYATHSNTTMTLQSFSYQFYLGYSKYCLNVLDNYDNTFGAKIKKLKQFLKFSESKCYKVHQGFKDKKFKILEETKEVVYLDDAELEMIWNHKQVKPSRSKVIDMLLFQSLTGLRVSDALKKHHIVTKKGERFVSGICKKNGGTFLVPLSLDSRIEQILKARSMDMAQLSEAQYNSQIKEVVKEAYEATGLEMPEVTYYRFKAGKPVEFTKPKYELITSHSMRRGFCSRHLNGGHFNESDVLEMLGSTDLKELQKYLAVQSSALDKKARASAAEAKV